VVLIDADEDEIDEFVQDNDSVYGYAPYLVEPEAAASTPARMEGVLRGDRVRRRPFGAGRPS
jgi:hypothetical protein